MVRGPKNQQADLSAEYVRSILSYDAKTGELFWRVTLSRRAVAGKKAGSVNAGRIKIGIAGRDYMAHRIIWLWMTGEWPRFEIDHKDRDKANNRWKNLREATASQNQFNKGLQRNNRSGQQGVCFGTREQRWLAYARFQGRHIRFGAFKTKTQAIRARKIGISKLLEADWAAGANH